MSVLEGLGGSQTKLKYNTLVDKPCYVLYCLHHQTRIGKEFYKKWGIIQNDPRSGFRSKQRKTVTRKPFK